MGTCSKCGSEIPKSCQIDGRTHQVYARRSQCLNCKPMFAAEHGNRSGVPVGVGEKYCTRCKCVKPTGDFPQRAQGGAHGSNCRPCNNDMLKHWKRTLRADSARTFRQVHEDSRRSDFKWGRENDLTLEFIRDQLALGCSYCGDHESRMTLDRIDNTLGHLESNVVPACYRCNMTRKDMPYTAWLVVAPGMRAAREQGLFGSWKQKPHTRINSSEPRDPQATEE